MAMASERDLFRQARGNDPGKGASVVVDKKAL